MALGAVDWLFTFLSLVVAGGDCLRMGAHVKFRMMVLGAVAYGRWVLKNVVVYFNLVN